jgi:hypothetical protein
VLEDSGEKTLLSVGPEERHNVMVPRGGSDLSVRRFRSHGRISGLLSRQRQQGMVCLSRKLV